MAPESGAWLARRNAVRETGSGTCDGDMLSQKRHIDDLVILHNMTGCKLVQTGNIS